MVNNKGWMFNAWFAKGMRHHQQAKITKKEKIRKKKQKSPANRAFPTNLTT